MRFGKNNRGVHGKTAIEVYKMKNFCQTCGRVIKKSEGSWCILCKAKIVAELTPKKKKIINEILDTTTDTSSK